VILLQLLPQKSSVCNYYVLKACFYQTIVKTLNPAQMLSVNLQPFLVLNTERLILRAVTLNDAEDIYKMRTDKEVMKYVDRPLPKAISETEQWIQMINDEWIKNNLILWVINLKGSEHLIGTIGYWEMDKEHHRSEIGYTLTTAYQGKGIMNEALQVVINYGFKSIKLHSIEANVNPDNQPSIKLLEKNGFVREGYYKENYYYNGKFLDSAIYSLLTPKS
jgi:ribosomal-protein-alanine N-acetyltransferase